MNVYFDRGFWNRYIYCGNNPLAIIIMDRLCIAYETIIKN